MFFSHYSEIEDFLAGCNPDLYLKANYQLFHYLLDLAANNFTTSLAYYAEYSARPLDEIQPIEKSILVLAAIELEHNMEVPAPVIINEAIELAKIYGGEDSFKFVNGLVDKLANQLRAAEMEYNRNNPRTRK